MTSSPGLARLPNSAVLAALSFLAGIGLGIVFTGDDHERVAAPVPPGGLPVR